MSLTFPEDPLQQVSNKLPHITCDIEDYDDLNINPFDHTNELSQRITFSSRGGIDNYYFYLNPSPTQLHTYELMCDIRSIVGNALFKVNDNGTGGTNHYPERHLTIWGSKVNINHPRILRQYYKSLLSLYAVKHHKRFGLKENSFFHSESYIGEQLLLIVKPLWHIIHHTYYVGPRTRYLKYSDRVFQITYWKERVIKPLVIDALQILHDNEYLTNKWIRHPPAGTIFQLVD